MDNFGDQQSAKKISVNFNLRCQSSKTPTPIYMVLYAKGHQTKISTGCKILPNQWDKKKQEPIISKIFSDEANREAIKTLMIINSLKFEVLNNFLYNPRVETNDLGLQQIKNNNLINNKMTVTTQFKAAKRTAKATNMMKKAFDEYKTTRPLSGNTLAMYDVWFKKWNTWVIEEFKKDSCKAFNQEALDLYTNYLLKNKNSVVVVNKCVGFVKKLINDRIARNNKYGITPVVFDKLKDKRKKEDMKRQEIFDDEIKALKEVALSDERLDKYRKTFVLQLLTGQRCSDLYRLIKGDYKVQDDTIILKTKKCETNAYIRLNDEIKHLIEELKGQFEISQGAFCKYLNLYLKVIAKEAHLDREITHKKAHTVCQTVKLCDVIESHFARHTFATKMLRIGFSAEEVGKMIGDSSQTVLKNYGHPTEKDEINVLKKAEVRINNVQEPTSQYNEEDELKKVLLMLGVNGLEIDGMDNYQIWERLTLEHGKLMELGVNVKTVKEIYNHKNLPLAERAKILQKMIEEISQKKEK